MIHELTSAIADVGLYLAICVASVAICAPVYYAGRAALSLAYGAWVRWDEQAPTLTVYDRERSLS